MPHYSVEDKIYEAREGKRFSMKDLLNMAVRLGASDLHITSDREPRFRIGSDLLPYGLAANKVDDQEHLPFLPMDASVVEGLVYSMFSTSEQREILKEKQGVDFSVETEKARFRVNVAVKGGTLFSVLRVIPNKIRELSNLGFPHSDLLKKQVWEQIRDEQQGLVLVTGITGSGKSTTLASFIQAIVKRCYKKIITIEDPVEYAFRDAAGQVVQREVGKDTPTFFEGVRLALRQDPDIIMIGETRDPDTAQEAIRATATGHLVLTTLHATDAQGAPARYIDLVPADRQDEVRGLLADNLKYVLSQKLVPYRKGAKDRVLAMEVLVVDNAVRNMIRQNKYEQLLGHMQSSRKIGSITLEDHLGILCPNKIEPKTAYHEARDKKRMVEILQKKDIQVENFL